MRFNSRINITKGINLNLSKSGPSLNIGLPGMSVTIGKNGVTVNRGIPGTYMHQREKVLNSDGTRVQRKKSSSSRRNVPLPVLVGRPEMDPIDYSDPSSTTGRKKAKAKAEREVSRARKPKQLPAEDDALLLEPYDIEDTEDFDRAMAQLDRRAQAAEPAVRAHEHVEDAEYDEVDDVEEDIVKFNSQREATIWISRLARQVEVHGGAAVADPPSAIAGWLSGISLPLEFAVDMSEFDAATGTLFVDLDLPEIEDLPDEIASRGRDGKLKTTEVSDAQLREDYAICVFGLGVFFASHMFALAGSLENITMSAFTQRRNTKGDIADEYIYSVKFTRAGMAAYGPLDDDDPREVAMSFENRCKLSRQNKFSAIEPYEP